MTCRGTHRRERCDLIHSVWRLESPKRHTHARACAPRCSIKDVLAWPCSAVPSSSTAINSRANHLLQQHELASHSSALPISLSLSPAMKDQSTSLVSLPVIDLSLERDTVRAAILDAGKELGFFQVINHGVTAEAMREMEAVCEEFFALPAEETAYFYSEDKERPNRFFSGSTFDTGGDKYLLDCLRLACAIPVGDSKNNWPHKPQRLRDVLASFIVQTRGVGMELLQLLCEAIGLRPDYFEGGLSSGDMVIGLHRYPPCPNPALGMPPHCDRNLITLLLPGVVPGLQVSYKGDWITVEPVPNAFVVNFGLQLEVVTNGMLKSIEHRVITNPKMQRQVIAMFIGPTADCLIGPAEEFLGEENPPQYRSITYGEFRRAYSVVKLGSSINQTVNLKNTQATEI